MNVVTTPMPVDSTNCRNCALARLRIVPLPARMSDRLASRISAHARSTMVSSGTGRRNRRTGTGGCVASSRAMSSGNSIRHAPGFSDRASRTALRTTSGIVVRVSDRLPPLGDRPEHADHVHDLMRLLVQPLRVPLPAQHQDRRPVHVGVGHPGDEVRGARPEGAETAGRVAGQPAIDLRHERRALLVPTPDEPDLVGLLERHHEVGVLLARHAEDVLDALVLETLHEQI